MARPTKEQAVSKGLERTFHALVKEAGISDKLNVREMAFARLVAEEGYTYKDAYIETFQPETANLDSIHQMSSRLAARPRVKAEIDRVKRSIEEAELKKEERLAVALHPVKAYERMAVELYVLATSSQDEKVRLKAWDMLGSMKHVDAFVTSSVNVDNSKNQVNNFGVKQGQTSDEAKSALVDSVRKLIGSRLSQQKVIDTTISIDTTAENVVDVV